MVKGNVGKSSISLQRTKVAIRHLPFNLTDERCIANQINNHIELEVYDDGKIRANNYKTRLNKRFGLANEKEQVEKAIPQLYSKHYGHQNSEKYVENSDLKKQLLNYKILTVLRGKNGTATKPARDTCCFVELASEELAKTFCAIIDGRKFLSQQMEESDKKKEGDNEEREEIEVSTLAVCELSTTRDKRKKPAKFNKLAGTLKENAHFKQFLERLENEKTLKLPSAEVALVSELVESKNVDGATEEIPLKKTSLGQYLESKLNTTKQAKWKKKSTAKNSKRGKLDKQGKKVQEKPPKAKIGKNPFPNKASMKPKKASEKEGTEKKSTFKRTKKPKAKQSSQNEDQGLASNQVRTKPKYRGGRKKSNQVSNTKRPNNSSAGAPVRSGSAS